MKQTKHRKINPLDEFSPSFAPKLSSAETVLHWYVKQLFTTSILKYSITRQKGANPYLMTEALNFYCVVIGYSVIMMSG